MTNKLKCTDYIYIDLNDNPYRPCQCPVCGGFLKWVNDHPICNKCGADLLVIPERDEETEEELQWGKICPISSRRK